MHVFTISLLTFWIKGQLEVGSNAVKVRVPNVVFGFIPLGYKEDIIPTRNISNIQINSEFKTLPLFIGGFMFLGSIPDIFSLGGLVFSAFWLFVAGTGLKTTLTFDKSGTQQRLSVPFFEYKKMKEIMEDINHHVTAYDDRSNLDLYFDKKETT